MIIIATRQAKLVLGALNCKRNQEKLQWQSTCISWSSVKADKLTKIGNLPINSGMRPYAIRSELSTWKLLMQLLDAFGRPSVMIISFSNFCVFSIVGKLEEMQIIIIA